MALSGYDVLEDVGKKRCNESTCMKEKIESKTSETSPDNIN